MPDKFKGQRNQSMTEAFERMYGPSMGANVEAPVCPECGSPMEKVGETLDLGPNFTRFSASLVPAPRCTECGEEMVSASATEWMCPNTGCKVHGQPRCMGVYPAKMVP